MSDARWQISMFGPLRLDRGGHSVSRFQTQKTASLLAYLSLNAGRQIPREVLCELLWPQSKSGSARASLNQALSWIRHQLCSDNGSEGGLLRADRQSVTLPADSVSTDVQAFLNLLGRAEPDEGPAPRKSRLEEAVGLYAGEFLQGQKDSWIKIERLILADAYADALRHLVSTCDQLDDPESAIQWVRSLIKVEPLDEDHHERIIHLYAQTDQRGAIQRHFSDFAGLLRGLGRSPSRHLSELVFKLADAPRAGTPRAVAAPALKEHRALVIPAPLTKFFGRDREIAAVVGMIRGGSRLVTLHGMSGIGKTRLSIEIAKQLSGDMNDALFVPLADVSSEREIAAAVLGQLGVKAIATDSAEDQLAKRLSASTSILIILDNLDHLVESGLSSLTRLLRRVPHVYVLGTSLSRLGLHGEQTVSLSPLPVPEATEDLEELLRNPSLRLYLDRAAAAEPGFKLTAENVAALVELCRRLEGLPLAIELAAAWTGTCTPQETLMELGRKFELLVSRNSDTPARHKSLRASLSYSYQLLPQELKLLLASLTVFEGGWTVSSASEVLGQENLLEPMRRLQDRSLVVAMPTSGEGSTTRFSMLQALREFGSEQLPDDERAILRARHTAHVLGLVSEADRESFGVKRSVWLDRLLLERPNILAALRRCDESGDFEAGLRIAAHFAWYWRARGPLDEGVNRLSRFLERTQEDADRGIRAEALRGLGHVQLLGASLSDAESSFSQALKLDRRRHSKTSIAADLFGLSAVALRRNELDTAQDLLRESIGICVETEDQPGLAQSHGILACVLCDQDRYEEAKHHFDECLGLQTRLQDIEGVARVYCNLGRWARVQHRLALARHYSEESLRITSNLGNPRLEAQIRLNLSVIASMEGNYGAGRRRLTESLSYFVENEDLYGFLCCVAELVQLNAALNRPEEAAPLMGIYDHLSRGATTMSPHDQKTYEAACASIEKMLTEDELERGMTAALSMPFEKMAGFAQSALASLEEVAP